MEELKAPGSASGAPDATPEIVANRFRIDALLGRGAMGTVYRATHLSLDRTVALKIINPEFVANTDITQRFAREARLMAKLRHPRAAMIFDAGNLPDDRSFIVMEYVEGNTLSQVLTEEGRLSPKRAVEIAGCICEVLSEAHSIGIVHRDLKPANVMLNERGVFVLDFGVAKMLQGEGEQDLRQSMTGVGTLVGTPLYMSPEQCLGQPVDARSDLYSLGIVLYEMLGGRVPFNDQSLSGLIVKQATAEPPPLTELRADIPPALVAVVHQLLLKKPEDRPATAAAVRSLLEVSLQTQPTAPRQTQPLGANTSISDADDFDAAAAPQTLTVKGRQTIANEQLQAQTNLTTPAPLTPPTRRSPVSSVAAALMALVAVLSVGAGVWFVTRSNNAAGTTVAANQSQPGGAPSKSPAMDYMDHSAHDDYAVLTEGDYAKTTGTTAADNSVPAVPLLSQEEAEVVITKITQETHHQSDGMQIVKTAKDSALVCLHNKHAERKTHMFVVERPNPAGTWDITARASLDVPEFYSINWSFEPLDADRDGFEEVLFSGSNPENTMRRFVLYAPRTRQTYSLLTQNAANGKPAQTTFSPNANAPTAAAFRTALQQAGQRNSARN